MSKYRVGFVSVLFLIAVNLQSSDGHSVVEGLSGFDLRLDQMWGFADKAAVKLFQKSPDQEVAFINFTEDQTIKTALENFGLYAFGKARLGEEWEDGFVEEFVYRFPKHGRTIAGAVGSDADNNTMVRKYLVGCYALGGVCEECVKK
jgi:hypothetical protein